MPASFSRLDLPSPAALDHVFAQVLAHSRSLLRDQLDADGLLGESEEAVCGKVLQMWMYDAKERIKGNVTIQGAGWRSWSERSHGEFRGGRNVTRYHYSSPTRTRPLTIRKHRLAPLIGAAALAPLDPSLQTRIQNLSRTIDELTEDATTHRRDLPLRRAEAQRARDEVVDDLRVKEEEERARLRKKGWAEADASGAGHGAAGAGGAGGTGAGGVKLDLGDEEDRVGRTLATALAQVEMLSKDMPEQVDAAQNQRELVLQLRGMPP